MPHTLDDVETWIGQRLVGAAHATIGAIKDIYLDVAADEPAWLVVSTGRFGGVSFVPLAEAESHGDAVRVPYDRATIRSAPPAGLDGVLSQAEELRLCAHYGLVSGGSPPPAGLPEHDDDSADSSDARAERHGRIDAPAVRARLVPSEPMRMGKRVVTEVQVVTDESRPEQIDVERVAPRRSQRQRDLPT